MRGFAARSLQALKTMCFMLRQSLKAPSVSLVRVLQNRGSLFSARPGVVMSSPKETRVPTCKAVVLVLGAWTCKTFRLVKLQCKGHDHDKPRHTYRHGDRM